MEAGRLQSPISIIVLLPFNTKQRSLPRRLPSFARSIRASSNLQGGYRGPKPRREWVADWVSRNDDVVRSFPIYVGGISLLAVLFNRSLSGIALVSDAGSSQSRADLLTLGLAVTNILTGLVWLSIRPKTILVVNPEGVECQRINSHLPDFVVSELLWAWESLSVATICRSLVIVYDGEFIFQIGFSAASPASDREAVPVDANNLMQGSLYQSVLKSGSRAVILQPLGDKGIAIIGGDTSRGFTTSNRLAKKGEKFIDLPYVVKGMDVSFSGILSYLEATTEEKLKNNECTPADLCYSLQNGQWHIVTRKMFLLLVVRAAMSACKR